VGKTHYAITHHRTRHGGFENFYDCPSSVPVLFSRWEHRREDTLQEAGLAPSPL